MEHDLAQAVDRIEVAERAVVAGVPRRALSATGGARRQPAAAGAGDQRGGAALEREAIVDRHRGHDVVVDHVVDGEAAVLGGIDELAGDQLEQRGLDVEIGAQRGDRGGRRRHAQHGQGLERGAHRLGQRAAVHASEPNEARAYSRRSASGMPRVRVSAASIAPCGVGP